MKIKGRWKRATAFMLAVLLCFSGTLDPGAVRAKAPGDSEKYMVTVEKCKNGTVTLERSGEKGYLYASGETVLARIQPDPGYERKELTVTDEKESSIIPEWDGDMISFPMPAADVVISAVFSPAEGNNGKKDTVPVEDAASGETDAAAKKDTASTEEDTVSAEKDTAPAEEDISSAEKDVSSTEKDGFSTGKDTASGNTEKTKESDTVPGDLSEEKDAGSGNDEKEQENAAGNLADPKGEETAEESGKDETSLEEEVRQTLENNGDVLESLEDEQSTALQMFSARAGEKTEIQVKALTTYYYADYGLGSGHTRRYEVTFEDPDTGDERTVYAYCLQPKKDAPGDCVCVIEPLSENKVTSKVIYYGTGELSGDDSFWARNQIPYDREGLRWIITHIAASKTSGDPDWDHNANSSARELANQLIEYAKTCKTSFPDPEVSFSQTHVTAYREVVSDTWERQRTPVITFNGDEKNYIRLVLPEGVSCLDADSNRVMIGSGIGEEGILIKGGTSFYFAAALDQAEKVSASSELTAYGNITTTYQTYKLTITYGSGNYQNLGMILATEVPSGERELSLTIDWVTVMGELHIEKYARSEQHTDSDKKLAGATFNLLDHQGKKVIPTGQNHITGDIDDSGLITIRPDGCADIKNIPEGNYSLREIDVPVGYQLPENDTPVNVIAGKENRIQVFNDQVAAGIKILKYDAETGKPDPQGGGTFENARFRIVTLQDCEIGPRQYRSGDVVYDALALDRDGYAETPANVLTEGRYRLEETGAPTGYLTGDSVEFAIAKSDHGKLKELTGGEIADPPIRGGLKIKKVDKDTKKASPQGNAVLEGARFEIVSLNENPVKVEGSEYLRGQTVYTMETGEDGTARTDARLLPYGSYAVQESSGGQPKGYLWNKDNYRTFSIDQDSDIVDLSGDPMEDPVVRGGVRISKYDGESGEMHPLGGASLENMEIVIYNESRKEVWVSGQMYRPGEIVHVMYTDADGYAETPADLLPYGSYRLVETAAPEGYLGKEEDDRGTYEQTITIERDGELVDRTGQGNGMTDFVKRGDFSIRKVNADTQKSMAGVVFRVTSMTTAESHVFMTDANGYYSTSSAYTPHSRNTNGGKSRDGMWFGLRADGGNTKVDDRLGALPCDTYRIEELAGDNNRGMVLFSDILTITENGKTIGLGTVENKEIAIGTTAKDSLTGTHYQTAEAGACIVDTVFYQNLDKGTSYTLRGRLVDQETGETVKDRDGNSISAEKAFTPTVSTGSVDVEFTFDASDFTGMTVVVFEELYQGGQKLAEHKEISDEGQTIRYPGIRTQAVDGQTLTDVSCATEEVTLIDRVSYTNLQAGRAYTLTGALMVKETGEAYVDPDGKPVAASRIFIPEASSGVAEVVFTFNGVNAAGRTLVAFEELSRGGQIYAVHTDLHDEDQTVYFPGIGTTASVESTGDRIAMAAASLAVTDRVAYSNLKAGQEYRLKGTLMLKETGEALLENGMPVTAEATFVPEEPEGTMDVKFVFDAENLAGNGVVVFEELYGNDRLVAFHKDIEDEGQTVYIPEIRTNAVDTKTQSHVADAAEEVTVRDTVTYTALIPGKTYKVVGTLMDKETGEAIETDGRAVTAEQIFQPLESDGTIDVIFQFNGMPLGGKTVVAFETLLYDEREVAAHRDIRDEGQSVAILAKGTVKGASTKVKKEDESTAQAEEKEKKPARKPSDVSGVSVRSTGAVKTGDTSHFLLWGILWLVSLSMLMFLRIKWKKGQRS